MKRKKREGIEWLFHRRGSWQSRSNVMKREGKRRHQAGRKKRTWVKQTLWRGEEPREKLQDTRPATRGPGGGNADTKKEMTYHANIS